MAEVDAEIASGCLSYEQAAYGVLPDLYRLPDLPNARIKNSGRFIVGEHVQKPLEEVPGGFSQWRARKRARQANEVIEAENARRRHTDFTMSERNQAVKAEWKLQQEGVEPLAVDDLAPGISEGIIQGLNNLLMCQVTPEVRYALCKNAVDAGTGLFAREIAIIDQEPTGGVVSRYQESDDIGQKLHEIVPGVVTRNKNGIKRAAMNKYVELGIATVVRKRETLEEKQGLVHEVLELLGIPAKGVYESTVMIDGWDLNDVLEKAKEGQKLYPGLMTNRPSHSNGAQLSQADIKARLKGKSRQERHAMQRLGAVIQGVQALSYEVIKPLGVSIDENGVDRTADVAEVGSDATMFLLVRKREGNNIREMLVQISAGLQQSVGYDWDGSARPPIIRLVEAIEVDPSCSKDITDAFKQVSRVTSTTEHGVGNTVVTSIELDYNFGGVLGWLANRVGERGGNLNPTVAPQTRLAISSNAIKAVTDNTPGYGILGALTTGKDK